MASAPKREKSQRPQPGEAKPRPEQPVVSAKPRPHEAQPEKVGKERAPQKEKQKESKKD